MGAEQAKLVTADWLAGEVDKPDIVVVDASWYLPSANRHGHAEFLLGHIPGAVFFDHDKVVDPDSTLPHALPSPEVFAAAKCVPRRFDSPVSTGRSPAMRRASATVSRVATPSAR